MVECLHSRQNFDMTFWDKMIIYRTYLSHLCSYITHSATHTYCARVSSIWFIVFCSFTLYISFSHLFLLCTKLFYRFPILVYPSFLHVCYFTYLMFNVLWFCDIFTSIVTCNFALSRIIHTQIYFLMFFFFQKTILTRHETCMSIFTE